MITPMAVGNFTKLLTYMAEQRRWILPIKDAINFHVLKTFGNLNVEDANVNSMVSASAIL